MKEKKWLVDLIKIKTVCSIEGKYTPIKIQSAKKEKK